MTRKKGLLIVFEGTDGTGKSTQLTLLARALQKKGLQVISSFEPTNGTFGKQIRELYSNRQKSSLEQELELFINDRKEHVKTLIAPALAEGKVVLLDRYFLSTIAYQGAAGMDTKTIYKKNAFAPEPDLALLFHAPISISTTRIIKNRGEQPNDFEKETYLQKVKKEFENLDFPYIRRVDANNSIDAVHNTVLRLVNELPGI